MRDKLKLEQQFREMLKELGVDLTKGDLKNTPERMARTWLELTRSYSMKKPAVKTFKAESVQVLGIHGMRYFALCEHHGLPFEGSVCVVYVPDERLVGLSKPARLVDYYSHFLMIQERFTRQLLTEIVEAVKPLAVYVVARGRHLCSSMRGVKSRELMFTTEEFWFKNEASKIMWEERLYRAERQCEEAR